MPGHGSISGLPRARHCHDSDPVLSSLDNEGLKLLTRQINLLWAGGSDLCWGSHGVHPVASSSELKQKMSFPNLATWDWFCWFMKVPRSVPKTACGERVQKLINDRRSFHFFQGREIELRAIYRSSIDWHLFTDSLFFLAASSCACKAITGVPGWCDSLLYKLGDHFHCPQH